jgi:hypothetical protein
MSGTDRSAKREKQICSNCGKSNASWRAYCEICNTSLAEESNTSTYDRKGCFSGSVILQVFGFFLVCTSLFVAFLSVESYFLTLTSAILVIFLFIIAWGFWSYKNWANRLSKIGAGLSIIFGAIALFSGNFYNALSIMFIGIIFGWFLKYQPFIG